MAWPRETNPHIFPQNQDPTSQFPTPGVHQHQQNQPSISLVPRTKRQELGPWSMLPKHQGQHTGPRVPHDQYAGTKFTPTHHQGQHSPPHELLPPLPQTTLQAKCFAGFWACFWTVVVLIGLLVLVIFFLSRPHSPKFDVFNVTLNTASLAPDALLHADLTMQVNYTNPNRNAKMEFSSGFINLYYGRTFIASQNIEPFFLPKAVYSLQVVQMVTATQIPLPESEMERLKMQLGYNAVEFEIKGAFHARAKRGNIVHYSYRLHVDCTFKVTAPPSGVLTAKYCKVNG